GHALALDHTGYGLTNQTNNLMTTGNNRGVASTSGCSTTNPTYGTNTFSNLNFGVLYDLGNAGSTVGPWAWYPSPVPTLYGTFPSGCPSAPAPTPAGMLADQLTTGSACTSLGTCGNQVGALSLSNYINATLAATADAGGGALTTFAQAAPTM